MDRIPYARHDMTEADIDAVVDVLRSDWIAGNGPVGDRFEKALAEYTGYEHAVLVNSGTSALFLAYFWSKEYSYCKSVLTSPLTFKATGTQATAAGLQLQTKEVEEDTWCLPGNLSISHGVFHDTLVVPVAFAGYPCQVTRGIIDAAHYLKENMADIFNGHDCIVSLHPVKHATCGEGGAILTDRSDLAEFARIKRSHGDSRSFNFRMSDINAALGLSQLGRVNENLKRRREIAHYYRDRFKDMPFFSMQADHPDHTYHLFVLSLMGNTVAVVKRKRERFMEEMKAKGITTQIHYPPLEETCNLGKVPRQEVLLNSFVTIPLFPSMTDEQVEYVADSTLECIEVSYGKFA